MIVYVPLAKSSTFRTTSFCEGETLWRLTTLPLISRMVISALGILLRDRYTLSSVGLGYITICEGSASSIPTKEIRYKVTMLSQPSSVSKVSM